MEMHAPEAEPIKDNDLVCERPQNAEAPKDPLIDLYHYEVRVERSMRPPADPENPADDVLDRAREYDTVFLEAVQRSLPKFKDLKPGGKATDYRSLKHWNTNLRRGPDGEVSPFNPRSEAEWEHMMAAYGKLFNQDTAQENDFIVRIEYPTGEVFPVQVRRLP